MRTFSFNHRCQVVVCIVHRVMSTSQQAYLILLVCAVLFARTASGNRDEKYYQLVFRRWKEKHGAEHDIDYYKRTFSRWSDEYDIEVSVTDYWPALLNFADNDLFIESHNSLQLPYKLAHNRFSSMSLKEFRIALKLGPERPVLRPTTLQVPKPSGTHAAPSSLDSLPVAVDWTTNGAVAPVQDQGLCGGCWAFAVAGAIEAAYFLAYGGEFKAVSVQNFLDCDNVYHGGSNLGCNGAYGLTYSFKFAIRRKGLCFASDYPFVSASGATSSIVNRSACQDFSCINAALAPVSFTGVEPLSEAAFLSALSQQPLPVGLHAADRTFQFYSSGVYTAECGTDRDHAVLAVGYGSESDTAASDGTGEERLYIKIKNSWGTAWGSRGYMLLERGRGANGGMGQCGLLMGGTAYPNYIHSTASSSAAGGEL